MSEDNRNKYAVRRAYMRSNFGSVGGASDQEKGVPQPPLCKPPMADISIPLPKDFDGLFVQDSLSYLLEHRRSHRSFEHRPLRLAQLSYLLWATQAVTGVEAKRNVTRRRVPSGGSRHTFETYLAIQDVEGLLPGLYHYLPMEHQVEFLRALPAHAEQVTAAMSGQDWTAHAPVVFFWSCVPYRAEWRFCDTAHRVMGFDVGHVGQNLYLAAGALGLSACCVATLDQMLCDALVGVDGEDEYVVYAGVAGHPRKMEETVLDLPGKTKK